MDSLDDAATMTQVEMQPSPATRPKWLLALCFVLACVFGVSLVIMIGEVLTSESYFDGGIGRGVGLLVGELLYVALGLIYFLVIVGVFLAGPCVLLVWGIRRYRRRRGELPSA